MQVRDAIDFLRSLIDGGHSDVGDEGGGGRGGRHTSGGHGAKILVFCHHQSVMDAIEDKLLKVRQHSTAYVPQDVPPENLHL